MTAHLITDRSVAVDTWKMLELADGETPEAIALPAGDLI